MNPTLAMLLTISVDTFGGYATLTGTGENAKQIEHATAIVKNQPGI